MKKRIKQKWTQALRSGKYIQGKGKLHDKATKRYCCLGVLRAVAFPRSRHSGSETGELLPRRHLVAVGLTLQEEGELVDMNDSGVSFLNIAHWIDVNL